MAVKLSIIFFAHTHSDNVEYFSIRGVTAKNFEIKIRRDPEYGNSCL